MDQKLQQKFPLSVKRKFWKKITEKSILLLFLSLAFSFICFSIFSSFQIPVHIANQIMVSILLGILFFLVLLGIYATYVHFYIKEYYYEDDDDFLTIKKGVFAPTEIHVQYMKIQDVYVDQDIIDRIFGLYDVHISSATYSSGIESHIDGVNKTNAEGLKNLLLGKIKKSTSSVSGEGVIEDKKEVLEIGEVVVDSLRTISFEKYGLSSSWWISESVKIAVASVATPIFAAIWLFFTFTEKNSSMTPDKWRILFFVWLAVFLLTVLGKSIYLFLWKLHYKYEFGAEYIYMKTGVLSVSEKNMAYNTIQDVKINQTFLDRIFGVADIVIENAAQSTIFDFKKTNTLVSGNGVTIEGLLVEDARTLADEIKKVLLKNSNNKKGL